MPLLQIIEIKDMKPIERIIYNPTSQYSFTPKPPYPIVFVRTFKYEYSHPLLPPHLFMTNKGEKYIIPTWEKVLPETTLDDIIWNKPKIKKIIDKNTFRFKSESIVRQIGDEFKCNCSGFFRVKDRKKGCKHIQELKQNKK